ncbi:hypothetical protein DVH05_000536 [Phytophthora capsici]|nr:hypothetical protein DVH05_000536 [Phytophthora capsici]
MAQLELWWYNLRHGQVKDTKGGGGAENEDGHHGNGPGENGETPDKTAGNARYQLRYETTNSASNDPPYEKAVPVQAEALGGNGSSGHGPKIKLSGGVRRVGRPKLNRADQKQKTKVVLKEYNGGMKLRALLKDNDVR